MSAKYFIDTNILIYGFDDRQPDKQACSLALIGDALHTGNGMISSQVVQEFLNVATRKFTVPLKPEDARIYLQKVLHPLCQVFPDLNLYESALDLQGRAHFSFYDSLILAGAFKGGCTLLYSEDFQHGQQIDSLKVVNPFLQKP
jgi:predicted nucleic acid-binding protein